MDKKLLIISGFILVGSSIALRSRNKKALRNINTSFANIQRNFDDFHKSLEEENAGSSYLMKHNERVQFEEIARNFHTTVDQPDN